jgi:THO complex subunit 2
MATLPSSKELQDAISSGDADVAKKLLEILAYATDASAGSNLTQRSEDASKVIVDVWTESADLEDNLVDALWLCGCTLSSVPSTTSSSEAKEEASSTETKSPVDALIEVIKALAQVPGRQSFYVKLQTNLLPSLLGASGLTSEEDLLKRLRIYNTQVNYKQQKYNLLQEDSEGYSKLLHFLVSPGGAGDESEQIGHLRQLLGTFELDPNRAMDLTIDILESKLYPDGVDHQETATKKPEKNDEVLRLLEILRNLPVEKLPSLLSFKLAGTGGAATKGLLRTAAFLSTEGLLDFADMYKQYSIPIEKEIQDAQKVWWMKEKKRILALTRISLSGVTKEDPKLVELKERLQKAILPLSANPVVAIMLILLQWGEWERVRPLMSSVSWEHLCSLLPERFGSAFCDMIQHQLLPVYQARVGTLGLCKPWSSNEETTKADEYGIDDLVESVSEPLLFVLNAGCMAFRPVLYCQLCRILRSLLGEDQETEHALSDAACEFFRRFMIPTISLFGSNPAISMELWSVLKRLPYATRYRLYEDWKGIGLERAGLGSSPSTGKSLPVVESEINAGKATRYALKRLSKENMRDMSRQLAKVTHCCPLVVYATILSQIESYDNMVEVMVEAQRFSNPLGLDVLGFCILSRLSGTSGGVNRSRLKGTKKYCRYRGTRFPDHVDNSNASWVC